MNIPNLKVYSPVPMGAFDVAAIRAGVEQRLPLLTYLFCPENEEEPAAFLDKVRYELLSGDEVVVRWRSRMRYPMRVYRFHDTELPEQIAMSEFSLSDVDESQRNKVRRRLSVTRDGIGFWPSSSFERQDMGWPLAMAIAATLAQPVQGIIASTEIGWLEPNGNEVRNLFDA